MKNKGIPDKWLYLSIIILIVYLIIRLIDQAKIITIFPLDTTNDYSGHMTMLYYLGKCGFHNLCPYWYNGYILFKSYTFIWFFFTYPIYALTKNIQLSTYISVITILILSFISIWFFTKKQKFSPVKRIIFFLFLFANAMSIGNFIRLGRVTELFAWLIFIPFFFLIFWYKDKRLDKKFMFYFIISYAFIMISHPLIIVMSQFLALSLLLVTKDKIKLIISAIIGLILSSFWWIPYILNLRTSSILDYAMSDRLIDFTGQWFLTNITTFIITIALWASFYFYWKSKNKSRKELIFFLPIFILSFLFVTRLVVLIPLLKSVYPDPYMMFFLFFTVFYLLKTNFKIYPQTIKKIIFILLILIPIISVGMNHFHTPYFTEHTALEEETISLLPHINGRFLFIGSSISTTSYTKAYYSYAPIYYDLSTASGWSHSEKDSEYIITLKSIKEDVENKNCNNLKEKLEYLNTTNLLAYEENCNTLNECGFTEVISKEHVCLYTTF